MRIAAEGTSTHPVAVLPAALISAAAVQLFWVMNDLPGYALLVAGLAGAAWTRPHRPFPAPRHRTCCSSPSR